MLAYGAFATISAPSLKNVTQPGLIKLEIEYTVYKEKISEVNRARKASRQVSPASIRNCIEPVLLQRLCILGQIEGAESVEEATNEKVQKWFDDRIASAPEIFPNESGPPSTPSSTKNVNRALLGRR